MNRQDYDTVKGINETLKSYATFTEMLKERRKSYYDRKVSLNEFYV